MEIPQALREALEQQLSGVLHKQLMLDADTISKKYRMQDGKGGQFLTSGTQAAAYAAARMPATFCAVSAALRYALESTGFHPRQIRSLLDAGAGTGAASWAADKAMGPILESITCIEREDSMLRLGRVMMEKGSQVLCDAKWVRHDLTVDEIQEHADFVVASYVMNEIADTERMNVAKKLWNASESMLLLVEPGTPAGFAIMRDVRKMLIGYGAHIAAPCPHEADCPKTLGDWCHFTCRVSRSRLHRLLKAGDAPYEDEKFTYMAFVKEKSNGGIKTGVNRRILRHPQVRGGHVMLEVCTVNGIENAILSKKDGKAYQLARKVKCGDLLHY